MSLRPDNKRNFSVEQTYNIALVARTKLSTAADQAEHNLRLLVGHANFLDDLSETLRSGLSQSASIVADHWSDTFLELDDDSDDSDCSDNFDDFDQEFTSGDILDGVDTHVVVNVHGRELSQSNKKGEANIPNRISSSGPMTYCPNSGGSNETVPREKMEESLQTALQELNGTMETLVKGMGKPSYVVFDPDSSLDSIVSRCSAPATTAVAA